MMRIIMIVLLLVCAMVAHAGQVQVGNDGTYRIAPTPEPLPIVWTDADFSVDPALEQYLSAWQEAYENGGKVVPIQTHKVRKMIGAFEQSTITILDLGAQYDAEKSMVVSVQGGSVGEPDPAFNSFLIFWMIGMGAMLVVVWRVKKGDFDTVAFAAPAVAAAFAAVAVAVAAVAAVVAPVAFAAFVAAVAPAFVAVVAAAFVFAVADFKSKIEVYIASAIYFLAMIVALVLNYGWV